MVTLFAYDKNMQQWLANNIQEIKVFCNFADRPFVNRLARRYKHKFRNSTLEIINCDTLNYRLKDKYQSSTFVKFL
jgi:hypothetical protein